MKKKSINLYRTITFLTFACGLILFVKNIDTLLFTNSFNPLSLSIMIVLLTISTWGYRKMTAKKKKGYPIQK